MTALLDQLLPVGRIEIAECAVQFLVAAHNWSGGGRHLGLADCSASGHLAGNHALRTARLAVVGGGQSRDRIRFGGRFPPPNLKPDWTNCLRDHRRPQHQQPQPRLRLRLRLRLRARVDEAVRQSIDSRTRPPHQRSGKRIVLLSLAAAARHLEGLEGLAGRNEAEARDACQST
ncbi:unnamed protein product [Protopolystoma xenopodis]|uniref:Uncharacterized protein n=1 Tax=Protopolystoma xenopodis TaxID=117903 RepID=A0A448WWH8_9PLAT|nr:unnamed protein product [Protopolystoma xenopodis]